MIGGQHIFFGYIGLTLGNAGIITLWPYKGQNIFGGEQICIMTLFDSINLVSVFIVGLFLLPIVCGVLQPLTADRIFNSFSTVIYILKLFAAFSLSLLISNAIFADNGDSFLSNLFRNIPYIWDSIINQDVLAYILALLIILLVINGLLQLLTNPLINKVIFPLAKKISEAVASMRGVFKRLISGIWQLPKALWLVLFFSLLFTFYSGFSNNTALKEYIGNSGAYQLIDNTAIDPILRSDAAKQIPVFIDETVTKAVESLSHEGKKMLIKVYINGVTVEDAVVSSPEIDNMALDLVGTKTDDKVKAHILYVWVSENIEYDYDKAEIISTDIFAEPSGAKVAYETRSGVCFDKACLYVAMCRAVGVQVRLITGLSFNGAEWCDHSWNQIYYDKEDRWLNVDTTFGKENNSYFDRADFYEDHKDEEIHGEW
jgi:hypothetical protein